MNSFFEAIITLILSLDKNIVTGLQTNICDEY